MLTVLDEYTSESRVIHVDRYINAQTVRGIMQKLLDWHGRHCPRLQLPKSGGRWTL